MKIINFLHHTFIGDFINTESIVVDLGANDGKFAEFIRDNFNCKVYAVEPLLDLFNAIKEGEKIKKFNYCINAMGMSCMLYLEQGYCATTYKKKNNEKIESKGKTLRQFFDEADINEIDLLKIDIEGAEIEVFEKIENSIFDKINQITVEFHDFLWPELKPKIEEIKKEISSKGFYCIEFSLTNNGDVIFIRKKLITFLRYIYLKYFFRYFMGVKRKLCKILNRNHD